jgi:hypothetical protein
MGKRNTRFTSDEQTTLLTLWSIARSPLIMGGDLRHLDDATYALLTNNEVLAVNQKSRGNREIFRRDGLAAWAAKAARTGDSYVALFNMRDSTADVPTALVPVSLLHLGFSGRVRVRDLWQHRDLGTTHGLFEAEIPCHGAGLYRLSRA